MKKNIKLITLIVLAVGFTRISSVSGEDNKRSAGLKPIQLPQPRMSGGKPLMDMLKKRKSSRDFKPDKLPVRLLSDLLWAAFGINRPDSGKRTAPSAMNWQEVDIYVVMESGVYLYNAKSNLLEPVLNKDVRGHAGTTMQGFVKTAPLNLVYVTNFSRIKTGKNMMLSDHEKSLMSSISAGAMVQNVYLFCASKGLAAVVRASIDRDAFSKDVGLEPNQKILVAQTVGYPK